MDNIVKMASKATTDELDLRQKKKAIETEKVNREYQNVIQNKIAQEEYKPFEFEDPSTYPSLNEAWAAHAKDMEAKLPFITKEISEEIPLTKQIYLVGAISGKGKTTMGAAMTHEVIKLAKDKKVLYLSNEEPYEHFMARLGCLATDNYYNDFVHQKLSLENYNAVIEAAETLRPQVHFVISSKTTSVSGIMEILEHPDTDQFSMIVLDYYQGINKLSETAVAAATENQRVTTLDAFKHKITIYKKKCPFIILTQLKTIPHNEPRNVATRIKWGTSIYEAAAVVVEAINIPSLDAMELFVDKGRSIKANVTYKTKFSKGKYYSLDDDQYLAHLKNVSLGRMEEDDCDD